MVAWSILERETSRRDPENDPLEIEEKEYRQVKNRTVDGNSYLHSLLLLSPFKLRTTLTNRLLKCWFGTSLAMLKLLKESLALPGAIVDELKSEVIQLNALTISEGRSRGSIKVYPAGTTVPVPKGYRRVSRVSQAFLQNSTGRQHRRDASHCDCTGSTAAA
jgi:hypothetical protein